MADILQNLFENEQATSSEMTNLFDVIEANEDRKTSFGERLQKIRQARSNRRRILVDATDLEKPLTPLIESPNSIGTSPIKSSTANPPIDTPANPPIDTPANPPIDTPANPPIDTPANPPIDTPANPPIDTPANPPIDTPANPPIYTSANPPIDTPANPPIDTPANPPIYTSANFPIYDTSTNPRIDSSLIETSIDKLHTDPSTNNTYDSQILSQDAYTDTIQQEPSISVINGHIYDIPQLLHKPEPPSSPPPQLTDEIQDQSLTPVIVPGDVRFSVNASSETLPHQLQTESNTHLQYDDPPEQRRRSVMSSASLQDIEFKPTLKKWDAVNLNEDSTPPTVYPPIAAMRHVYTIGNTDIRPRSSSGVSRISSGLESITETTLHQYNDLLPEGTSYEDIMTSVSAVELPVKKKKKKKKKNVHREDIHIASSANELQDEELLTYETVIPLERSSPSLCDDQLITTPVTKQEIHLTSSTDNTPVNSPIKYEDTTNLPNQLMMKLHMHNIHSGILYKMFRVTGSTTCGDLIKIAMKKANVIEDEHCYAIYNIDNNTNAILYALKESDTPLPYLVTSTSSSSHWELRQQINIAKNINVIIELPEVNVTSQLNLTVSIDTTSHEAISLICRKLHISLDDDNSLRLLAVTRHDERLVGESSPILHNRIASEVQFKLVNIVHHLTKDLSLHGASVPNPTDLETARAIITQSYREIVTLKEQMIVKDREIDDMEKDYLETKYNLEQLQIERKMLKEEQKRNIMSLEEVHEIISQLKKENDSISSEATILKEEKEKLKNELKEKDKAIVGLKVNVTKLKEEIAELKTVEQKFTTTTKSSLCSLLSNGNMLLCAELVHGTEITLAQYSTSSGSGSGYVIQSVAPESILEPGDRLIEVNGKDVTGYSYEDIVGILQTAKYPKVVVSREQKIGMENERDYWKENYTRLVNEMQLKLNEKQQEIDTIENKLRSLCGEETDHIKELRQNIVQSLPNKPNEVSDSSLADLLKDASREEILDALKTVELDCIKHKDSLDHLFGLIIGHTPELLSVMAEVQQPDSDDDVDEPDHYIEVKNHHGWC